jgi:hypothetical protein
MGLIWLTQIISGQPLYVILFIVGALLFIPFKKWLDRSRAAQIAAGTVKHA